MEEFKVTAPCSVGSKLDAAISKGGAGSIPGGRGTFHECILSVLSEKCRSLDSYWLVVAIPSKNPTPQEGC